MESPKDLVPLDSTHVRRFIIDGEWVYSLDDIVDYFKEDTIFYKNWWRTFTQKRDERGYREMVQVISVEGFDVRVVNATGIFRLVQGLKGGKADRVKNWIAQIAVERVQEELDPSLAIDRAVRNWYSRGRSDAWIMERLRGIKVRRAFTDEMQVHGADHKEFAILTNIVHIGTFGISVKDHYELKSLVREKSELREEMTTTELLLLALGEHTSTMVAKSSPVKNFDSAKSACHVGGSVAGETRGRLEKVLGKTVVTSARASDEVQPALE